MVFVASEALARSRPAFHFARHQLVCAALTFFAASLLLVFGPPPGDAAVHLYRTYLVRSGALVWDNFWYDGHYPLAGYSLLYYLPAALFGNVATVLAASAASALLFASIARREWGEVALWPSRVFAICAAAPLFTGLYSYALGLAALLGTLRALQARRVWLAALLAALTLGFSPLAFAFLCLVLGAVFLSRPLLSRRAAHVAAAVGALGVLELALMRLFPSGGVYPFHLVNLVAVLGVSASGALLARRAAHGRVLVAFFALWGLGGVAAALVSSPIGGNWTRPSEIVFPLMLLTAWLARFEPRRLTVFALGAALAYNTVPFLLLIPYRLDDRPAAAPYWREPLRFLRAEARPGFRVEVVPTAAHWESYWIPHGGFALARGWYRQLDAVDNPELYAARIDPASYRRWLRREAVAYVLLPSTRLDFVAAPAEARLLRSGRSGLAVAHRDRDWTIYRVPSPTSILAGPGAARVTSFGHTSIAGSVSAPGRYLLRVRYAPVWKTDGGVCVRPGPAGLTFLDIGRRGRFSLTVAAPGDALVEAAHRTACTTSSS